MQAVDLCVFKRSPWAQISVRSFYPYMSALSLSLIPPPCNNDNKMGYSSDQMAWKETWVVKHCHPKLLFLLWANN